MKNRTTKFHFSSQLKKNRKILNELETFLDFVPPQRLSKNLRKMFMIYLSQQNEGIDLDMNEQVMDLYFLFELLDAVAETTE
ncbi:MAG: hypothetical protein K0R51_1996 [Cytophagaceae bacterium]|jgi:flagellin-specific chaperone FliS|nr:hypothetical protein [Cytophagaceae bacterium]